MSFAVGAPMVADGDEPIDAKRHLLWPTSSDVSIDIGIKRKVRASVQNNARVRQAYAELSRTSATESLELASTRQKSLALAALQTEALRVREALDPRTLAR